MGDSYDGGDADVEVIDSTGEVDDGDAGYDSEFQLTAEDDGRSEDEVALGGREVEGKTGEVADGDAGYDRSSRDVPSEPLAHRVDGKTSERLSTDAYERPTHWRSGMREEVWESAKDEHGRVRDPVSGRYMSKEQPWDMGHKPGYEFHKHQQDARERGISRSEFLDEYYVADHYRPELPSSNQSHKGEDKTSRYFG